MDIKTLRIEALRQVIGTRSQKDFADLHDLDASYLSQILNGHRVLGEKAAHNLEQKIGLVMGTLVHPPTAWQEVPPTASNVDGLLENADPRALEIIKKLTLAVARGKLSAEDMAILAGLADILQKRK
ncbi:putative phage repressor [Pseudomonas sp. M47T1]|uniref:hypothetical protein n=1 Tax=Pseudomonas sp. M47T1 TaxID=1179778 RepID=UPI0002607AEF|nr:hypothetical protein [Pseudomonas sp. M47T1]EIK97144.1 putative phage repressor [Pseudomonas sp. M47T1]